MDLRVWGMGNHLNTQASAASWLLNPDPDSDVGTSYATTKSRKPQPEIRMHEACSTPEILHTNPKLCIRKSGMPAPNLNSQTLKPKTPNGP